MLAVGTDSTSDWPPAIGVLRAGLGDALQLKLLVELAGGEVIECAPSASLPCKRRATGQTRIESIRVHPCKSASKLNEPCPRQTPQVLQTRSRARLRQQSRARRPQRHARLVGRRSH